MGRKKKLIAKSPSPQVLAHPSKQQRPKFGQSPSGWPGDQQVDTLPHKRMKKGQNKQTNKLLSKQSNKTKRITTNTVRLAWQSTLVWWIMYIIRWWPSFSSSNSHLISSRNSFMEQEVFDETIPRPRSLFGPTGQEPGRSRHLMWNNVSTYFFFFSYLSSLSSNPHPDLDALINPNPHDPHQWGAPLHCRLKIAPRSSHNATQPSCSPR